MHQRAALRSREYQRIEFLGKCLVFARQDHAAARAAQRLVGRRRADVGVRNRIGVMPGSDEPGNVCHVDHQVSANAVGDLPKARPVDDLRIRRETGNNKSRFVLESQRLYLVVVDQAGLHIEAVLDRIEQLAREIRRWHRASGGRRHRGSCRGWYRPASISAWNTAALACEPECGCTLA